MRVVLTLAIIGGGMVLSGLLMVFGGQILELQSVRGSDTLVHLGEFTAIAGLALGLVMLAILGIGRAARTRADHEPFPGEAPADPADDLPEDWLNPLRSSRSVPVSQYRRSASADRGTPRGAWPSPYPPSPARPPSADPGGAPASSRPAPPSRVPPGPPAHDSLPRRAPRRAPAADSWPSRDARTSGSHSRPPGYGSHPAGDEIWPTPSPSPELPARRHVPGAAAWPAEPPSGGPPEPPVRRPSEPLASWPTMPPAGRAPRPAGQDSHLPAGPQNRVPGTHVARYPVNHAQASYLRDQPPAPDPALDDTAPLPVIIDSAAAEPPPEPQRGFRPAPDRPPAAWPEPAGRPNPEPARAHNPEPARAHNPEPARAVPAVPPVHSTLEQLKDLYLTAEAIGDDALDKHFDQISQRQRSLIRDYFEQAGLRPPGGPAPLGEDPAAPPG